MKRRGGLLPASAAIAPFSLALTAVGRGHAVQGQAPVQLELERTIALLTQLRW